MGGLDNIYKRMLDINSSYNDGFSLRKNIKCFEEKKINFVAALFFFDTWKL